MSHRLSVEICAELQLLALYSTDTQQSGLKVHHGAAPELIAAAARLYEKRLITQPDGGYLTDLGYEAAHSLDAVLDILGVPG